MSPLPPGSRFLLYAHDGTGIGHAVRACTIARALCRLCPTAEVVIASGSPALTAFAPAAATLVQLPARLRRPPDGPPSPCWKERRQRRTAWRRAVLAATAEQLDPHVALIDHLPLGPDEELDQAVCLLARRGSAVVLGYRRIAEDEASTREVFGYPPSKRALAEHYRAVLTYAPAWFGRRLGPLPALERPTIETGFVCRRSRARRGAARRALGLPDTGRVVTCGLGGGRGAWPLARSILRTWREVGADGILLFFCGPLLEVPRGEAARWRSVGVRLLRGSARFPLGVAAADGVVTTAGYNSMLEALSRRRPTWAIPNQAVEKEQENSSGLLSEMGLVSVLPQGDGFEAKLMAAFRSILEGAASAPEAPLGWFDGARHTAEILSGFAAEKEARRVG